MLFKNMIDIKDSDFRKFPRRSFTARVRIHDHIRGRTVSANATDINPMGMFIETKRSFQNGETVSLVFPSPEGDYELSVTGEVVRVRPRGDGKRSGVAVEFFGHEDWIFDELCSYVYGADGPKALTITVDQNLST